MTASRNEQILAKMQNDQHEIAKQLKRIADILNRVYPKRIIIGDNDNQFMTIECDSSSEIEKEPSLNDVVICKTPSPSETRGQDRLV